VSAILAAGFGDTLKAL